MLGLFGLFRKQPQPPARKMTAAAIYASAQSGAGVMVTPDRAMRVSTVYACVRIIAESIAQLPCKIYRRKPDGGQETLDSGPLFDLLHFPNPWQNSFEFREYMMTCLCLRGNFFALKVQRRGEVLELLPLRPDSVKVERRNWKLFYTYTDADGNTGTVGEDKMLHVNCTPEFGHQK